MEDFCPVGGGIAIQPNGLRVLRALGLLDALRPRMSLVDRIALERADGRVLAQFHYRDLALPYPYVAILARFELQEHLLAAAVRNGIAVRFGQRCTGVTRADGRAVLHFAAGPDHDCDVVVGADGVHSVVREVLGFPVRLRALGWAALRGTVEVACNSSSVAREIWGPDGRLFGIAPLPGTRTYFYCSAPLGDWPAIRDGRLEDWIEGWHGYGPEVRAILRAVDDWPAINFDEIREVRMRRWHGSPIFLIGDAAHAMAPNWGQGANSAMVDALVLMHLLAQARSGAGGLEDAGRRYEAVRRRFVGLLQTGSRIAGGLPGWASPPGRWVRDALLGVQGRVPRAQRRTMALVAGHNSREEVCLARL
jgi:2-polyprenyl-6-methoxyphenol hydroxylase-like FAD-dependent oxidoreductase